MRVWLWALGLAALILLAQGQEDEAKEKKGTQPAEEKEATTEGKGEKEQGGEGGEGAKAAKGKKAADDATANDWHGGIGHHGHHVLLGDFSSSHHSSSSSHKSSSYSHYDSDSYYDSSSYHDSSDSDFLDSYESHYDSDYSSKSSHHSSDDSYSHSYIRYGPNHCLRKDCHRSHGHVGVVRCDRECDGGVRLKCSRKCEGERRRRKCSETCRNHGEKYFQHRFKRRGSKLWHWTKYWDIHGTKFECQARCRLRSPLVFCRKRCFKEEHLVSDRLVSYNLYSNSIHASDAHDVLHPHIAHDLPTEFAAPKDDDPFIVDAATAKGKAH